MVRSGSWVEQTGQNGAGGTVGIGGGPRRVDGGGGPAPVEIPEQSARINGRGRQGGAEDGTTGRAAPQRGSERRRGDREARRGGRTAAGMAADRRQDAISRHDAGDGRRPQDAASSKGRTHAQAAGGHSGRDAREGGGGRKPPSAGLVRAIVGRVRGGWTDRSHTDRGNCGSQLRQVPYQIWHRAGMRLSTMAMRSIAG